MARTLTKLTMEWLWGNGGDHLPPLGTNTPHSLNWWINNIDAFADIDGQQVAWTNELAPWPQSAVQENGFRTHTKISLSHDSRPRSGGLRFGNVWRYFDQKDEPIQVESELAEVRLYVTDALGDYQEDLLKTVVTWPERFRIRRDTTSTGRPGIFRYYVDTEPHTDPNYDWVLLDTEEVGITPEQIADLIALETQIYTAHAHVVSVRGHAGMYLEWTFKNPPLPPWAFEDPRGISHFEYEFGFVTKQDEDAPPIQQEDLRLGDLWMEPYIAGLLSSGPNTGLNVDAWIWQAAGEQWTGEGDRPVWMGTAEGIMPGLTLHPGPLLEGGLDLTAWSLDRLADSIDREWLFVTDALRFTGDIIDTEAFGRIAYVGAAVAAVWPALPAWAKVALAGAGVSQARRPVSIIRDGYQAHVRQQEQLRQLLADQAEIQQAIREAVAEKTQEDEQAWANASKQAGEQLAFEWQKVQEQQAEDIETVLTQLALFFYGHSAQPWLAWRKRRKETDDGS